MRTIIPAEGNPALREIAREIPLRDIKSVRIKKLIAEMKALLTKEKHGVAIAAAQVGESLQLFIVSGKALTKRAKASHARGMEDGSSNDKGVELPLEDQIYINPVMTKVSRKKEGRHEGCLSIRGKWGLVPRAEKATVKAYNERGVQFTRGASGFLAHIFQHETDHLKGVLYTDKATELFDEEKSEEKEEAHS